MKQKSLRQLAKELGVSHSYLSQVRSGKRPASQKVVSKMVSTGKQCKIDNEANKSYNIPCAEVAQMVEQRTENATPAFLIEQFIASRRDGLSPLTIKNYRLYLRRA